MKEHRAQDEFLDAKAKANILRQRMEPLPEIHDCSALENAYAELKAQNFELREEIKQLQEQLRSSEEELAKCNEDYESLVNDY